jgi:hypothetical protein
MLGPHPFGGLGKSPTPLMLDPTALPSFQRDPTLEEEEEANLRWYTV